MSERPGLLRCQPKQRTDREPLPPGRGGPSDRIFWGRLVSGFWGTSHHRTCHKRSAGELETAPSTRLGPPFLTVGVEPARIPRSLLGLPVPSTSASSAAYGFLFCKIVELNSSAAVSLQEPTKATKAACCCSTARPCVCVCGVSVHHHHVGIDGNQSNQDRYGV